MEYRKVGSAVGAPRGSGPPSAVTGARGGRQAGGVRNGGRGQQGAARAEVHLMRRVFDGCHRFIAAAGASSPVRWEFLGALIANESGGNASVRRFEPSVYRHLKSLSRGDSGTYAGIGAGDLAQEVEEFLHPKAGNFHARYLNPAFAAHQGANLGALTDEALREFATSWGFTQVMGYHVVGREATVRDLLEPQFHFRMALELFDEFAAEYQLDLAHDFEEMFRCWNTGAPYGQTFDPNYVANGLRRLELYRLVSSPPEF